MSKDEEIEDHPSYVAVNFSRRTGNPGRLFGSHLKSHEAYITLQIKKAKLIREDGYDRIQASMSGDILEVDFSAAQFAELLTTMNVGVGTPATLRRLFNKDVERAPEIPLEVEKTREHFKKRLQSVVSEMRANASGVKEVLEKKSPLSKADKEVILKSFERVEQHLASNLPFILELFEEAAERVVTHSKAEIDAFLTHNIIAEGLRSLVQRVKDSVPQLPPKEETEKE